jgi:phosphomannomutase
VVVDCGNGIPGILGPGVGRNCNVIPLHCEVDGNFPNHHPTKRPESKTCPVLTLKRMPILVLPLMAMAFRRGD